MILKKVIKSKKKLRDRHKNKNITKCKNKCHLKGGTGEGNLKPSEIKQRREHFQSETRNMTIDTLFEEVNKKNIPLRFLTSTQQQEYIKKIDDMLENETMVISDVIELIKQGIIPLGLLDYTLRDAYYRSIIPSPSVQPNRNNHMQNEPVYILHPQQPNNLTPGEQLYSLNEYIDVNTNQEPTVEEFIRKIFEESPSNQPPLIPLGTKLTMNYIADFIQQKWTENRYSPLSRNTIKDALSNINLVKRHGRIVISTAPRKIKRSFYELNTENDNNEIGNEIISNVYETPSSPTYEPFLNIDRSTESVYKELPNVYQKFKDAKPLRPYHIYDRATSSKKNKPTTLAKHNVLRAIQQLGLKSKLTPGILTRLEAREKALRSRKK
jgi:hypothetical protein